MLRQLTVAVLCGLGLHMTSGGVMGQVNEVFLRSCIPDPVFQGQGSWNFEIGPVLRQTFYQEHTLEPAPGWGARGGIGFGNLQLRVEATTNIAAFADPSSGLLPETSHTTVEIGGFLICSAPTSPGPRPRLALGMSAVYDALPYYTVDVRGGWTGALQGGLYWHLPLVFNRLEILTARIVNDRLATWRLQLSLTAALSPSH